MNAATPAKRPLGLPALYRGAAVLWVLAIFPTSPLEAQNIAASAGWEEPASDPVNIEFSISDSDSFEVVVPGYYKLLIELKIGKQNGVAYFSSVAATINGEPASENEPGNLSQIPSGWVQVGGGDYIKLFRATAFFEMGTHHVGIQASGWHAPDCCRASFHKALVALNGSWTPPPTVDSRANYDSSGTSNDPINTHTGELYKRYPPDLDLGGPMPLVFSRYYASKLLRAKIESEMGDNWRHSFDWELVRDESGITVIDPEGRLVQFTFDEGTYALIGKLDISYQLRDTSGLFTLKDPRRGQLFKFNLEGQLETVEDGKGHIHTLTYNGGSGFLESVSDGLGRTLTFMYAGERLSSVSDGVRTVSFSHTGKDLTAVTNAKGHVTTKSYTNALMTSSTEPEGNTPFTQGFSPDDKVVSQADSAGNSTAFEYVGVDTTIEDPLSNTVVHTHTIAGQLQDNEDQDGNSMTFGSDSHGRRSVITEKGASTKVTGYHGVSGELASSTLADGSTVSYSYAMRMVDGMAFYDQTEVSYPDGTKEEWTYDAKGNKTSYTDQRGAQLFYSHSPSGQRVTDTNKLGGSSFYTYHADQTLETFTDPAGSETSFDYDGLKRLSVVTHEDGATRNLTWDDQDLLTSVEDERGNTTTLTYDDNGRLASYEDSLGDTTTFTYDDNNRLVSVAEPVGGPLSASYDELGRVEEVTDGNGNATGLTYDKRGNLTALVDGEGNPWGQAFDVDGFRTATSDPLGNTVSWERDSRHRITKETSPLGNQKTFSYDAIGRIVSVTDPAGETTGLTYDANGDVTSVQMPAGVQTSYARNALGQIEELTDPKGSLWEQAYDPAGRVVASTDPLGNVKTIDYDDRSRPSVVTLPGAIGTASFTYDAVGNVTKAQYSDGTERNFTYDANDRVTAADGLTQTFDAAGRLVETNGIALTRDPGGRVATMTLAAGKVITYAYDANDQVVQISDWVGGTTDFTYDQVGRLTAVSRPNGVETSQAFDAESRVTVIEETKGPDMVSSIQLTRDAVGRTAMATRNVPQVATAAALSDSAQSFDAASQVAANTYDGLGRQTAEGTSSFTWDLAGRLGSYTIDGTTVDSTYDATGLRLSKTVGGTTKSFVWNRALRLPSISIEREGAVDTRYYVHTPEGELLYSIDAATDSRKYHHYDEMGNTVFVSDDAGDVAASYSYTPYGDLIAATGGLDNPFTWQGRYGVADEGNGLYYKRARYYDCRKGRFLSRDPERGLSPRRVNPYQYAMGNPLRFVDPVGKRDVAHDAGVFEGFTDSTVDKALDVGSKALTIVSFYGGKRAEGISSRLFDEAKRIRRGGILEEIKIPLAKSKWKKLDRWNRINKGFDGLKRLDKVAGAAGKVVTFVKQKEASDTARAEGRSVLQAAQDNQAAQIDAILEELREKRLTPAEAEKMIIAINTTFNEAVDTAWVNELVDNGLAAAEAAKDFAKGHLDSLLEKFLPVGGGDLVDGVFTKIGETGIFVFVD